MLFINQLIWIMDSNSTLLEAVWTTVTPVVMEHLKVSAIFQSSIILKWTWQGKLTCGSQLKKLPLWIWLGQHHELLLLSVTEMILVLVLDWIIGFKLTFVIYLSMCVLYIFFNKVGLSIELLIVWRVWSAKNCLWLIFMKMKSRSYCCRDKRCMR